jgi:arylsulfatase A-like enzyme
MSALDPKLRALADAVPEDTVVAVTGDHGESVTHRSNPLRLLAKVARDAVRYYGGVDTRDAVSRLNRALADWGPDVTDHFIENGHGENVFDFTTNVPFVVAGPGVESGTVDAQVRQVDVTPTLLDQFGLAGALDVDGEAIRPDDGVESRPAYMRACGASLHRERNWARAIRTEDAKYVVHPDRDWEPRVYDLAADPAELAPADDPELERRLADLLPESGPPASDAERLDIDEHLKSLGYR